MPFVLAVFALLHLIALHTAGSSNPLGITSNVDKLSMHPYYSFKDLITVFAFLLMFTLFVFFSPDKLGQGWPTMLIILVLINIYFCAICWNHIHILKYVKIYSKTINLIYNQDLRIIYYISIFIILFFIEVTYYYVIIMTLFILNSNLNLNKSKVWNQQVTYTINYIWFIIKGTSETTRTQVSTIFKRCLHSKVFSKDTDLTVLDIHNKPISKEFKQWFAGLVDGDGYLYVNKDNNCGFEITMATHDEKVLKIIQNTFGGNFKPRSGVKAIRYRTQKLSVVKNIVNCLNGYVYNSVRLSQLHNVCLVLDIKPLRSEKPSKDSAYISGLLDSDGTINYYSHNKNKNLILWISISNKYLHNIDFLEEIFGGYIQYDKAWNGTYKWNATALAVHKELYDYFNRFTPKSIKSNRTSLIQEYLNLYQAGYYKSTEPREIKIWKEFVGKWNTIV